MVTLSLILFGGFICFLVTIVVIQAIIGTIKYTWKNALGILCAIAWIICALVFSHPV